MCPHSRKNYMPYDETPTKGTPMDKTAIAKIAAKIAISGVAALAIGYTIKAERAAKVMIDEHFAPETEIEILEVTES